MLKEYNVDDVVMVQGCTERPYDLVKITKRYSINPEGPKTYYDGVLVNYGYPVNNFHISQIVHNHDEYNNQEPKLEPMTRESILDQAKQIVMQDRNLDYGSPEDNFRDIAELWTTYTETKFDPHDVAVMMVLVKISRLKTSPSKEDHWVDIAGYAACGAQAVGK